MAIDHAIAIAEWIQKRRRAGGRRSDAVMNVYCGHA